MITCRLEGAFAAHPNILWEFEAEPEEGELDGPYSLLSDELGPLRPEITYAGDDMIVYSDGFVLRDPLKVQGINPSAMTKLLMYLDNALEGRKKTPLEGSPTVRAAILLSEALDLWREDLEHAASEYEPRAYRAKPKKDLDKAVEYANTHPERPLKLVADLHDVPYPKLTLELRQRAFTQA